MGEEKDTWTARKTLRVSRSLALFHASVLFLEVARGRICGFVTWSLACQFSQVRSGWREVWRNLGFFLSLSEIFGGHTRTAKEPGQRPSNQTLYRRLSFTTRQDIRRQANPRVAGRLSHGCPGEARAFSGFCDDWTARTLTPTRGMPRHRAVGLDGASAASRCSVSRFRFLLARTARRLS